MTVTEAPITPQIKYPPTDMPLGWHLYTLASEMLHGAAPISNYPDSEDYEGYNRSGLLATVGITAYGDGTRVTNYFYLAFFHLNPGRWPLCAYNILLPRREDWQQAKPADWTMISPALGGHDTGEVLGRAVQTAMQKTAAQLTTQGDKVLEWRLGGPRRNPVIRLRVTEAPEEGDLCFRFAPTAT